MYYSNGNYEAFAHPRKPEGIDEKSAYIVGAGLAGLSAAAFLVRDAQMDGSRITILESMSLPGGACDGIKDPTKGFIIRGGREMENHFECLWDLFRSIPSVETEGVSVLDEYYWLNKDDPNYSLCRATVQQGLDAQTNGKFALSDKASRSIMKLFLSKEEQLDHKKITDVLDPEFFESNFWLYWRTMFAFEPWHSAIEMRRYLQRFIHHIGGLPDFTALKFTKFNQFESLIKPLVEYLRAAGVNFQFDTTVSNVKFDIRGEKKTAVQIVGTHNGNPMTIDLTKNDLVFITNGSCTEGSANGDHDTPAAFNTEPVGCWEMWRNIAKQHDSFGNPERYCTQTDLTNWESATLTTLDGKIRPYIEKITKRDALSGRVVTGGIVTVKDSNWLMSWTINRQPHFKAQTDDQIVVWIYSLFTDRPGDYIKKPMRDCTGEEIAAEWLYHIGVPREEIPEMAAHSAHCIPVMMPFITAFFMPRENSDRPKVVPDGSQNFAFIGQFAEIPRDTIFTTEYSVRSGMESVYTLCGVDRGVPEVFGSVYDVRTLMASTVKMMDGKTPLQKIPGFLRRPLVTFLDKTVIGEVMRRYSFLPE